MHQLVRALIVIGALTCTGVSMAQPVPIRIGYGVAAEEQLWLMKALPSITPGQGKIYNLDMSAFRGTDQRFQAFEAGQLDLSTGSGHSALFAMSQGMKGRIVASVSRETKKGFSTQYMVLDSSPIKTIADLKGKTVGNNAARSSIELWARIAFQKAGLNPERDVQWAVVPFPAQGDAVRSGKLDLGAFPQPFAANEKRKGGMRVLFTSKDANPYDEELILLIAAEPFAQKQPVALRAFLADFVAATRYYLNNEKQAKQALLDAKLVLIPAETFFAMDDYERDPNANVDLPGLEKMQDDQLKAGFQKTRIDVKSVIDSSFLPK